MKLIAVMTFLACSLWAGENWTLLKSDEQIVFYPSIAQRVAGNTNLWRSQIRGCVFELERRGVMLAALREALELKDVELTDAEQRIFNERARLFLVDHERGKKVFIRLGTNDFFVGKSGADGRFAGEVLLDEIRLERRVPARPVGKRLDLRAEPGLGAPFAAALKPEDRRAFSGAIFPLETEGISVISDIDDTIKVTEMRDRHATLRNTFLREFQAVPGMAQFYQTLTNERNASFHYVSASPWQLYEPLAAFVASNGFPAGTFELKPFRWKDRNFFSLFASPEKYKPSVIEPLLKQFPKRTFVLIGDSGERDPEIYGALARKFPEQIFRILIRDVTNESSWAERYQKAFRDVPTEKWQIFREPSEIKCLCE
ncbi:MAG: phosphatase domain-containing protein [Verrucomicrobiota bacterium]